jgi:hypothetical protein
MQIQVPTLNGSIQMQIKPGAPVVLLGANGTGKSRLGIYLDELEKTHPSHRIAAQRSLELPEAVISESYESAVGSLRRDKSNPRKSRPSPGSMEYNFDQLLTALFAERNRALEDAHLNSAGHQVSKRPETKIDTLQRLWTELVPHQTLMFSEGNVRTRGTGVQMEPYEASQMSDGERLIFYVLGQALLLEQNGLLIVDEPELHMNRALMVRLWDAVEHIRSDCSFLYITHDVDFASSRVGGEMYAVLGYKAPEYKEVLLRTRYRLQEVKGPAWDLKRLPNDGTFDNDVLVRIAGSRKPILFVEGKVGGLDHQIYKAVYGDFTVIPAASCGQVIQLVRGFRAQPTLHWLECAGLVDRDHRRTDADGEVRNRIYALPVNEVENLLLMQPVFEALAEMHGITPIAGAFKALQEDVFALALKTADRASLNYARSHVWNAGKSFGIKAQDISGLMKNFQALIGTVDPVAAHDQFKDRYRRAIESRDYEAVLTICSEKNELVTLLAKHLKAKRGRHLVGLIAQTIQPGTAITDVLRSLLPKISLKGRSRAEMLM